MMKSFTLFSYLLQRKKRMNVFHAVSKEERFMNDVSLLATHETTILYYNTETITKQAQVKIKGKQNREETE